MSNGSDWLERFYLKDIYVFSSRHLSQIFAGISSRLTKPQTVLETLSSTDTAIAGSPHYKNNSLKSLFTVIGASVVLIATPLLCAYVWKRIYSSQYFIKSPNEFEGMGIVITGCDSGIGIETAAFLSQLYPDLMVFAGCLRTNGVTRLVQLRRGNLIPIRVDITKESELTSFVNTIRSRLVRRKLYAVINNAGIYNGTFFEATSTDIYNQVMSTNFLAAVAVTKAFLPLLVKGDATKMDGGRIINISSAAALLPSPGNTAYCASKAALAAFTHGIRQELREIGIKVIQVVPGPLRTDSLSQISVSASTLLSSGPEEVLQRYGGQSFIYAYSKFFESIYKGADPPSRIAQKIRKILIRRYPRDVYFEETKIYNLLTICPHFLRDFLMDPKSFRKQIMTQYVLQ
eukprot:g7561.t1